MGADAMAFAERLAADLKKRAGYPVFLDQERLEKGGLWEVRIERGIREPIVRPTKRAVVVRRR